MIQIYYQINNYPYSIFRGVKATLWEGGVRGTGFIHSPLLQKQGYVAEQMIHVTDWMPTLYRAAGGDPKEMGDIYLWNMISKNEKVYEQECCIILTLKVLKEPSHRETIKFCTGRLVRPGVDGTHHGK